MAGVAASAASKTGEPAVRCGTLARLPSHFGENMNEHVPWSRNRVGSETHGLRVNSVTSWPVASVCSIWA